MNQRTKASHEELLQAVFHLQSIATKLAKLVNAQQEAIQLSDLDTLEAILQQKQTLLEQLSAFRHLKQSFEDARKSAPDHNSQKLTIAVKQLEECIEHISRAEETTIHVVRERHGAMARQLRELIQHRQATNHYSQAHQTPHKGTIDITS